MRLPYSLYLHIPFCMHRCGYCDFNTYAGLEDLIPGYVEALCREIGFIHAELGEQIPLHTIFFGGGTPSLLRPDQIEVILTAINQHFSMLPGIEITLEANPGTLSQNYLTDVRSLGVNRLSLGVQSSNPAELRLLERQHSYFDVIKSVAWARRAGFDNLNLDLIFGLPFQELAQWQTTLELTLGLNPEHLSLYSLTIEHGTPLGHWAARGLVSVPDPDKAADMYEWATQRLEAGGWLQYEISNWARIDASNDGLFCRHNLQYWRGWPYLGLGAGAHGYAVGIRTVNTLTPLAYIQRMQQAEQKDFTPLKFPRTPATLSTTPVDYEAEIGETMMMGLRLVEEGVGEMEFFDRFQVSLSERFGVQIGRFTSLGLLEFTGNPGQRRLRLTKRGRLLGNRVFMEFI